MSRNVESITLRRYEQKVFQRSRKQYQKWDIAYGRSFGMGCNFRGVSNFQLFRWGYLYGRDNAVYNGFIEDDIRMNKWSVLNNGVY